MYQLKKQGKIDHMMFSVYLNMFNKNTHIKFGGYDVEGIKKGDPQNNL